jgi:3-dehydroquinate dehydratase/shikimate dehydrogenase
MICVVIKGPTIEEAYQQIAKAAIYADLVELRLDYFKSLDLAAFKNLRSHFSIPMIFTLRSHLQGGSYAQPEENRLATIQRLIELEPEYIDLENHVSSSFIEEIALQSPVTKVILSYHNFTETPKDLEEIYQKMQKTPAFFYKIAVTAQDCLDAMSLICWAKKAGSNLIAISMGPYGQISRILAPIMGCPITYAALEEDQTSAPGQLTARTLIERYRYRSLNHQTTLYGLIGDPVDRSISDETHNNLLRTLGINAVYIKIQVEPPKLSNFLQFAKQMPFLGLSVTMPLKEHVFPLIDCIQTYDNSIGAVNTLHFEGDKISGFNTDGIGALNAIEKEGGVKDKRIVIIGAGGAAKAIAYEAKQRGALVIIINRDIEKALQLAQQLQCIGNGLDYMAECAESGYDILINCTPIPLPIDAKYILPSAIVMDIMTKPKETEFLKIAKEKGCSIVYGYQMFVEQALGQFNLWFKDRFDMQYGREILEIKALEIL